MIQDTVRNEFRRALTKQVDANKFFKMIAWITLSLSIVINIFMFHYYECDDILFEHERISLRRLREEGIPRQQQQQQHHRDKGIVVDFDVFERDDVFHGFRTVRMNTSDGYPVTCTIPVITGSDAKKVEEVTSFDSPFETDVIWLEDAVGLCKQLNPVVVAAAEHNNNNNNDNTLQHQYVVGATNDNIEMCSGFQLSLVYSVVSLIVCWLVVVSWDQKLMKYNLSDFLKDRKDLTDLLKSYEAQNSNKSERKELHMAVDSVRESVLSPDNEEV